jgi:hypothetical protein
MPIIPLELPPGIFKNATPYVRKGRWESSNLVRWDQGSVRPIGGWVRRQDTTATDIASLDSSPGSADEAFRDGYAWRSISQDQLVVFGSNQTLKFMSQLGVITDITPGGAVTSSKDAQLVAGYGRNPYSVGFYGVANNLVAADPIPPVRWGMDNFGEDLLFLQRGVGPLYLLDSSAMSVSTVGTAPAGLNDVLVTDQRIVFGVAPDTGPRTVVWSDQEDASLWAPAVDNQAGDYTLTGSGRLLRAFNVLEQILILGEDDANVARYTGPPYIYSFATAGENCGMIAAEAGVATERFAVWWGDRQFWLYDGSIKPLDCALIDFLDRDVNFEQISKVSCFTISKYSEVWWLYQSNDSDECDSYICWNYRGDYWSNGRIARTVGIDSGTLQVPVMVSTDCFIYNHEQLGTFPDTGEVYVESAGIDLTGDNNTAVRYIYPDSEVFGDITMTITARQFPTGAEFEYGPYAYSNPTPTRAIGRELKFRFDFSTAASEVGTMRVDIAPMNTGRR